MTTIGKAYVEIHAEDKLFEKQIRQLVKKIPKQQITMQAKVDLKAATSVLSNFRKTNNAKRIHLDLDLNTEQAERQAEDFYSDNDGKSLSMNLDIDPASAWRSLETVKNSAAAHGNINLKAEIEEHLLHRQIQDFEEHYQNNPISLQAALSTEEAVARLQTLQAFGETNPIDIDTKLDSIRAEAKLAALTRDRDVKIRADFDRMGADLQNILRSNSTKAFRMFTGGGNPIANLFRDPEISNAIEGAVNATAGIVPPKAVKTALTGLAANFEQIVIQAALAGTAVSAIGSAAITAGGFVANLITDLGELVGLAAILPAVFAGWKVSMISMQSAWEGFSDALVADPEEAGKAIATLYEGAQDTAWALQKIVQHSDRAIKTNYWDTLGDSVERTAKIIRGDIVQGMGQVSTVLAENTDQVSKSVRAFAEAGGIRTTFDNIVEGLQNATGGTKAFSDALLTLTEEGSKRLPHLGEWFTTIGDQFNTFIQDSAESGAILRWIDQGVQRLQELGSILGSTGSIIASVSEAAEAAGIGGLTEMAGGFERLADTLDNFRAQTDMRDLFRDASASFESMMSGTEVLASHIRDVVPQIGDIFTTTGTTVETALGFIGRAISETGMMDGLVDFFNGIQIGIENLEPSFMAVGEIVGHIGEMGGELVQNLAPGLNFLFETLAGFLDNLKEGFIEINPVLNDMVRIFTDLITGPLMGIGSLIGGLMSAIAGIPAPILATATAAGLAAVAVGKLTTAMAAIKGVAGVSSILAGMNIHMRAMNVAMLNAGTNVSGMGGKFKRGLAGAGGAMKGLGSIAMGAMGGPIGLAVGAAVAALGFLVVNAQENQRKYDESVQGFADSWDPVTQKMSGSAEQISTMLERFDDMKVGGAGWDSFSEHLSTADIDAKELAQTVANLDRQELSTLAAQAKTLDDALTGKDGGFRTDEQIDAIIAKSPALAESLGVSTYALKEMDRQTLRYPIAGLAELATEAEDGARQAKTLKDELSNLEGAVPDRLFSVATQGSESLRETLIEVNEISGTLRDNFETISSTTSTVAQKISAVQSNMDVLRLSSDLGGSGFAIDAIADKNITKIQEMKDAIAETGETIDISMVEGFGGVQEAVINHTGGVSEKLKDMLEETKTAGIESATAAFDAIRATGGSMGAAVEAAQDAIEPARAEVESVLRGLGITSQETIDGIIERLGISVPDIEAAFMVDGVDKAIGDMVRFEMLAEGIRSGSYEAYFTVMTEDAQAQMEGILGQNWEAQIDTKLGLDPGEKAKLMQMIESGASEADIRLFLEESGVKDQLKEITKTEEKRIDIMADTGGQFLGQITDINREMGLLETNKEVVIAGVDNATPILDVWNGMEADDKQSTLQAIDTASVDLSNFNAMPQYDKDSVIAAIDNASPALSAWNSMSAADKQTLLSAIDMASPKLNAWNVLPAEDKDAVMTALDRATAQVENWNALSQDDKDATIDVIDKATPKNSAWNQLTMDGKEATLEAIDQASPVINNWNRLTPDNKTSTFTIITKRIEQIQRNISVNRGGGGSTYVSPQADGGILSGSGFQSFASGGITKAMQSIQAHNFAGGSERHVAQIARGKYPYRVWAEPETQGEAYIPLAPAKRPRSLNILSQVARKFGFSLMKQFADGGFETGGGSSYVPSIGGIQSFADGGLTSAERAQKRKEERERVSGLRVDFTESAKNALQSFVGSIKSLFGHTTSPVVEAVNTFREQIAEAVKRMEGTNKGIAATASRHAAALGRQTSMSGIWKNGSISEGLNFLDSNVTNNGALTRSGRLAGVTLKDLEYAQSKLNSRLEDARDILQDLNSQFNSARSGLRGTLEGGFDVGSLLGGTDSFGYRAPVTSSSISSYARNYAARLKTFGQSLIKLRRAGYNPFLVDEIANMGLEDGAYIADALLADKSQLGSINESFTDINGSWGRNSDGTFGLVGGLADSIGKSSAEGMFKASQDIFNGLVSGMETNLANIESLGRRMADSLVSGFKKALGISSPSRVFFEQTGFVTEGIVNRLDKDQALVSKRFTEFATPEFDRSLSNTLSSRDNNSFSTPDGRTTNQAPVNLTQNIYPTPGMSEEKVGQVASSDIAFKLNTR